MTKKIKVKRTKKPKILWEDEYVINEYYINSEDAVKDIIRLLNNQITVKQLKKEIDIHFNENPENNTEY